MSRVEPFIFKSEPFINLKWYANQDTLLFYHSILSLLNESPMSLVKLNGLLAIMATTGILGEKYQKMGINELFFHLQFAVLNLGGKKVATALCLDDWDTQALYHIKLERKRIKLMKARKILIRKKLGRYFPKETLNLKDTMEIPQLKISVKISTVDLPKSPYSENFPFESMVFVIKNKSKKKISGYFDKKYESKQEAITGHKEILQKIENKEYELVRHKVKKIPVYYTFKVKMES